MTEQKDDLAQDANVHARLREEMAKVIYDAFPFDGDKTKPAWVENGNSIRQDDARRAVRSIVGLLTKAGVPLTLCPSCGEYFKADQHETCSPCRNWQDYAPIFDQIIALIEEAKVYAGSYYGVAESVGADIALRSVKRYIETPALRWKLSDGAKVHIAEIDGNRSAAAMNASTLVTGSLTPAVLGDAAIRSLVNEVAGIWEAFELGIRQEISNTNYVCVAEKLAAAELALRSPAASTQLYDPQRPFPYRIHEGQSAPRTPAASERQWCTACGTVSSDGVCDCNRYGQDRKPQFVNYADAMQKEARDLAQENARLVALVERANAHAAEWRAMAKRHDDAASTADEIGMDDDELCIHIESSRIYNLCADAIGLKHSSTMLGRAEVGK